MSNFSLLWGPALQWQIQFKLSQNTCIRISPGRGAGSTSDVGQTLSLGALPCFSVIALLSRIGVGKRWGLGAIRSDSFRWIETFSLTRKCDKEQSLGTGSGTESITFAIILYLLVYFDSMWFVFQNPKKNISCWRGQRFSLWGRQGWLVVARLWRHGICTPHTNVNILELCQQFHVQDARNMLKIHTWHGIYSINALRILMSTFLNSASNSMSKMQETC